MRQEFVMTEKQHADIMNASKPVPYVTDSHGNELFGNAQENANRAWKSLAHELHFVWDTVQSIPGKNDYHFSAEVAE